MKKKQLFAGALTAAMMTASLAGCGGAASSAATSIARVFPTRAIL